MIRIEIGRRNYLLYLLLPHPLKLALLSPASRERLDRINRAFNEEIYSGERAAAYDSIHGYAEAEQHEYPAQPLVASHWAPEGYGRALELGAGSGYFTALIARRAERVLAVEPVPDLARLLRERCRAEGLANVEVVTATAETWAAGVAAGAFDSALVIQSLHHFHRRPEVFATLARALRPAGRLYLLEPHHNLLRAARLFRKYLATYHAREFWTDERNWATHDFVTRGELGRLCRGAGFTGVRVSGYWIPCSRRVAPDAERRFRLERRFGRLPGVRHWARVLALEARRAPA
ncbi:MAG: class I SAM-dependent methyltransferase [Candidatus Rokubacteria bacterium]|nr:class I SAM-dependent methyltransferase [Candidatus Rokubacteria bacterium]MBI3105861.1 class I SAM-dependent methyltransferase [Candidatus Rokubacteria bacterium]